MFEKKIKALQYLKVLHNKDLAEFEEVCHLAQIKNKWFTPIFIDESIGAILDSFLDEEKLAQWLNAYKDKEVDYKVALIPAGNIPLVGFHDLLCCFVLNTSVQIKLSSKDEVLMNYFIEKLKEVDPDWNCEVAERLVGFDKVIATGSNNTHRYFEQYFGKVPSLLRKNRNSVAILDGSESAEELKLFSDDVLKYFGMGCRNVSKVFVPKDYDITALFPCFEHYQWMHNHPLYRDNYDYNRTLLLMNSIEHLSNDFLMIKEDESLQARIATLHYSFYENVAEVDDFISSNEDAIQCIVGKEIDFGKAQRPELWDYADHIDTIEFLQS